MSFYGSNVWCLPPWLVCMNNKLYVPTYFLISSAHLRKFPLLDFFCLFFLNFSLLCKCSLLKAFLHDFLPCITSYRILFYLDKLNSVENLIKGIYFLYIFLKDILKISHWTVDTDNASTMMKKMKNILIASLCFWQD